MLYEQLQSLKDAEYDSVNICYRLGNVLAESGGVTRGICEVSEDNHLISVTDRFGVERVDGKPMFLNELRQWEALDENSLVSMNMWGFMPDILEDMQIGFERFFEEYGMDMKAHYSIPGFMNGQIERGVKVKVIETSARWMGLVSLDDKIQAMFRVNEMIRKGIYPSRLFKKTIKIENIE